MADENGKATINITDSQVKLTGQESVIGRTIVVRVTWAALPGRSLHSRSTANCLALISKARCFKLQSHWRVKAKHLYKNSGTLMNALFASHLALCERSHCSVSLWRCFRCVIDQIHRMNRLYGNILFNGQH